MQLGEAAEHPARVAADLRCARRGTGRQAPHGDRVADQHALAGVGAHAGGLVAERRRVGARACGWPWRQHLHVGPARRRRLDPTAPRRAAAGSGTSLDAQVLRRRSSSAGPHGTTTALTRVAGRAAAASARAGVLEREPVPISRERVDRAAARAAPAPRACRAGPADQLAVTSSSRGTPPRPSSCSGGPGCGGAYRHSAPPGASAASRVGDRLRAAAVHTIATSTGSLPWRSRPSARRARSRSGRARAPTRRRRRGRARRRSAAGRCTPAPDDEQRVAGADPGAVLRAQRAARAARSNVAAHRVDAVERQQLADQLGLDAHVLGEAARVEAPSRGTARTASRGRARQRRHSPHGAWWWIATRSPTATPRTSAPTATTSPTGSCPSTAGSLRATYQPTSEPHDPAGEHAADDVARAADGVRPSSIRVSSTATASATFTPPSHGVGGHRLRGPALGDQRGTSSAGVTSKAGLRHGGARAA